MQRIVYTKNKEISRLKKQVQRATKGIAALNNDLSDSIFKENIEDDECKNDMDFIMATTTTNSPKNTLTFRTLEI